VLRWAWRLFRREWRQQLLTLVLLTVAVAGAVWASSVAVNAGSKARATLGDARAMIRLETDDPSRLQADMAAIQRRFDPVEVIAHSAASAPGVANHVDVRAQDPHGRYGHSTLALRRGRYPGDAGEVALTERFAGQIGVHLGGQVTLDRVSRTVVGFVENPRDLDDQFALVAPSTALPGGTLSVLIGRDPSKDDPATASSTDGRSFDIIGMGDDQGPIVALVVASVTASMALVGLVAASGFLVVAHRRQHQLGLLAALGATERHLRLVLVAAGALVGVAAAVVGAVLGIGVWLVTVPMVERASAHRIDRLDLPWPLLALCVVLAIAAAIGAAWWPARTVSRVPVMAAISQRPPAPLPVRRSAALATFLLVAGVAGIALSKPRDEHVTPWLLVAGVLAVIAGTVLVAPSAIRAIAVPARRLPLAPRLALRDLVRYQARAATALAAITLALSISVATAVLARASDHDRGPGNLSDHQLLVSAGNGQGPFAKTIPQNETGSLDRSVGALAQGIGASTVLPLDVAMPNPTSEALPEPVSAATPANDGFRWLGPAYVGTPELLTRYGIDPSTIQAFTELLAAQSDVVLIDTSSPKASGTSTPMQRVELSSYSSAPRALITEAAMRRHGWTAQRAGWLLESSAAFSTKELATARRSAAAAGLVVESRDSNDQAATLGRAATIAGSLLALAILAMTIGLIRGESAADVRTLTAVGAPSRTRRAVTAASAGALALAGVVLASAGAYVALVSAYRSDLSQLTSPPVVNLLALAIGLPVLAAGAGWALAGREPAHVRRDLG
jgi:putative ABC transport system permease protein